VDRPALKRLLADIEAGRLDIIVVYKIDRLTRSLPDFAKLVEVFDRNGVSFVSVTQQFNTTTSKGPEPPFALKHYNLAADFRRAVDQRFLCGGTPPPNTSQKPIQRDGLLLFRVDLL
jgi:DNA invertase Pin-like site-specific DNA recombinase